jgi:hypothetical protein
LLAEKSGMLEGGALLQLDGKNVLASIPAIITVPIVGDACPI